MKVVLNHLDSPIRILGVKIGSIAILPASFICGALFDNFLATILSMVTLFITKSVICKLPKFTLMRFFYQNLPTQKVFGKAAPSLLESHIKIWVKS